MNADGTGQKRLTRQMSSDELAPRFSSNGDRIMFESVRASGRSSILTIDADGNGLRRLVGGFTPDWRPTAK